MSMHFAPQWVRPIKPTGPAATVNGDVPPPSARSGQSATTAHPFPALNPGRSSPSTLTNPAPALSYSKITHAQSPQSPSFPSDNGSFSPYGENGNAHPFRYSREQILALWSEDRVKEVPIELAELMEHGGVLVSKEVVKPIGMRDLNDIEKKLLSSSVHPTGPARQRMPNNDRPERTDRERDQPNGHVRRPVAPPVNGKDASLAPGTGRGAFGGFGRGEGGAFGIGKIGSIGSGAAVGSPGNIGGGFGGVPKRIGRRTESSDMGPDAVTARVAAPWRTTRTASGQFEGVLGFGQPQVAPPNGPIAEAAPTPSAGWRERQEKQEKEKLEKERQERERIEEAAEPTFGKGGGPGWGSGQKKWRMAAGTGTDQERTIEIPSNVISTDSVAATASATPVPDRDASVRDISLPQDEEPAQQTESLDVEKADFGAVLWYYRDPEGQEQGSFTGNQMHEWYSHSYFQDDLPLRRSEETKFHTLAELKAATGNSVQPFLSAVKIQARLPPNLPIPASAMPLISPSINGHPADAFRNLAIHPQQPAYNQYMPERASFSAAPFGQFSQQIQSPGFGSPAAAAPWSAIPTRGDNFAMRSPFGAEQYLGGPQPYSPAPGAPVYPQHQPQYAAPNPWGVPGGMPQPSPIPQPVFTQIPIPASVQHDYAQQEQPRIELPAQPEVQEEEVVQDEPSYFPPVEAEGEEVPTSVEEAPEPAPPVAPAPEKVSTPAPASVWGQVTPAASRKQSIASPTPAPATVKSLPSSLPPKPAAIKTDTPTPASAAPATPSATQTTSASAAKPAVAPWGAKEDRPATPTGPSLRDIQEAEAKAADLRRLALSEARASAQTPTPATDDVLANMSWGLPSTSSGKPQGAAAAASPVATPAPAWGSGDAGPKRTLKQIQEEEEKRKRAVQAVAAAKAVAAGGAGVATKRGYADLAANAAPAPPAGWSTVGLGGKVIPGAAPKPAGSISTPTKPLATPTLTPSKPVATPTKKADDLQPPSGDFLKWAKTALTGLKIPVDDFIQMLLTFPIDPPAATRPETLEIISDSVYANSATLDGRRFAQEFMDKRKADAKRGSLGKAAGGVFSMADAVKAAPARKEDVGFKVVKAKGKKKN